MSEPVVFKKEMAITHQDFIRLLTRAYVGKCIEVKNNEICILDGRNKVEITLSEESERKIALITLPVTHVKFSLFGYENAEREIKRVERHFQRGGG